MGLSPGNGAGLRAESTASKSSTLTECTCIDMSEMLPLFPLSTVLFPGMRLPLHIFEERYQTLVADLLAGPEPRRFGVIAIRAGREVGADSVAALHEVGCVAVVRQAAPTAEGRYDLLTVGTDRFRLVDVDRSRPYLRGEIELLPDDRATEPGAAEAAAGTVRQVQAGFRAYLNALADQGGGVISIADLPDEPGLLSYVIGAAMIIDLPERQSLLAAPDAMARLRLERSLLVREIAILRATTTRPAPDYAHEQFSPN
jgi:Lon protease-like protein